MATAERKPHPMMACGHLGTTVVFRTQAPVCAICYQVTPDAEIIVTPPDLTGRTSRCPDCKRTAPSSLSLPFFEYRGPGSRQASQRCKCGFYKSAHDKPRDCDRCKGRGRRTVYVDGEGKHVPCLPCLGSGKTTLSEMHHQDNLPAFEASGGDEFDSHYDGCRGWD